MYIWRDGRMGGWMENGRVNAEEHKPPHYCLWLDFHLRLDKADWLAEFHWYGVKRAVLG